MAPNISARKHIKWADNPAFEDTTTVVLTSNKGFYVDIRLLLDPSLSNHERVQWAFAGTAENVFKDGVRHTTWYHFVDNKSKYPDSDSGDMWEQPDGDTLEKGAMAYPTTGEITPYEELWTDLDIGGPYPELGEDHKVCIVLQLDLPEVDTKGIIARIGERIQGVVRVGDKIDFGIWVYEGAKWIRTESLAKDSPLSMAPVLFRATQVPDEMEFVEGGRVGNEVEDPEILTLDSDRSWQVVEKFFIRP